VPQGEQRLLLGRGGELLGDGAEQGADRRRQPAGDLDPARGALVVLLGPASHLAGLDDPHQARLAEHLEVVVDGALLRVQGHRQLADRRRMLAEHEEQPLPQRMGERLELRRGGDLQHLVERRGRGRVGRERGHDESDYNS
jgi:hypothetical protein